MLVSVKYHYFINPSVEDAPTLDLGYAAYTKSIISSYIQDIIAILSTV